MELREAALNFLMSTNQLPKQDDIEMISKSDLRLSLSVFVDTIDLLDKSARLAEFFLQDTQGAKTLIQDVIKDFLEQGGVDDVNVFVTIRFWSLPRNDSALTIKSVTDFPPLFTSEKSMLKSLIGILQTKSSVSSYVRTARYLCSNLGCVLSSMNYMEISMTASSQPAQLLCTLCNSPLCEELRLRESVDCLTCQFLPDHLIDFAHDKVGQGFTKLPLFAQSIQVIIPVDTFSDLELGGSYEVIGHPAFINLTKISAKPVLEATNITRISSAASRYAAGALTHPEFTPNIFNVFTMSSMVSPWTFVSWLATMFGETQLPRGSYFHLKMAVLFSMAMLSEKDFREPLSLLVATHDTAPVSRLITHALSLTTRKFVHSIQNPLGLSVKKILGSGSQVEAGSLVLAQNGVCFLGDLKKFPNETIYRLRTALESGEVHADVGQANFLSQPLKSTPWAFASLPSNTLHAKTKFCQKMQQLFDVFGLVIFPDEENDLELSKALSTHILRQAIQAPDETFISHQEWKLFLLCATERKVTMSAEAELLLKKYFVASRRARSALGITGKGSNFPQGALNSLTNISKAHAKLCQRSTVTVEDCVAACRFYEMNLVAHCGYSPFGLKNRQHFFDVQQSFFSEYHEMMVEFQESLTTFIDEHMENSSFCWEE